MASDWMISTLSANTATGPSSAAGLRPAQSRHLLPRHHPNRRLVNVENVLTDNIGTGAIRGSVFRAEREAAAPIRAYTSPA
jgi:hypothetical protein